MGGSPSPNPAMPLYALPTTTGTGSETSGGAVITFDFGAEARKGGVGNCQPALAFLDPDLVVNLPAPILAASGLDALTHAVEVTAEQAKVLHDVIEGLCIRTGLPKPRVYIVDDPAPNAFSIGQVDSADPRHQRAERAVDGADASG